MRRLFRRAGLALVLGLVSGPASAQPAATDGPAVRYQAPLQEELERLGLNPLCERLSAIRARCTFHYTTRDGRFEIVGSALYSDESDTVYLWIPGVATALRDDPATPALLQRLMELNGTMLSTKFEWNPVDGEVRLSAVLPTDSNFDRRALRNLVRVLLAQAERRRPEIQRLIADSAH